MVGSREIEKNSTVTSPDMINGDLGVDDMSSCNADISIISGLVSMSLFVFRVKQCVPLPFGSVRLFQHMMNAVTTIPPSISNPTLTVTPATSPTMFVAGVETADGATSPTMLDEVRSAEVAVGVGKMRSVFVGVRLEVELVCSE